MQESELYYVFNPWWEGKPFDYGILRSTYLSALDLKRRQIEIISGSRRIGKTTLLFQLVHSLLASGTPANRIFYLAADHPRLSSVPLSLHLKHFRQIHSHSRSTFLYLFFDEVQSSPSWEAELKVIYDLEQAKIICTGSTPDLLQSRGGKLTGRQVTTALFPLSFQEFLSFRNTHPPISESYKFETLADEYLHTGGYPENVLHPSSTYLQNLLDDIVARDVIALLPIRKPAVFKDLLLLLASAVGSRTSYNKLSNVLGISVDTVKEYIGYLESAFLIKPLTKWTTSHSDRVYAQKKFYFTDTGLKTFLTGEGDRGAKAENAVYIHILRNGLTSGYFAESKKEVDFVLGNIKTPVPIEVKYTSNLEWLKERTSGLRLFQRRFPKTKKAIAVTRDIEMEKSINGLQIQAIPLWKFLMSALEG